MEEITNNLYSIGWWFSVVAVGILVSIIGAYSKSAVDYAAKYALTHFSSIKEKGKKSTQEVVAKLNSDPDFRDFIFQAELRAYVASIAFVFLGLTTLGMFIFVMYQPELSSMRWFGKYLAPASAICMYFAGTKFLSAAYLGRGLILAAQARFKL